MADTLKRPLRWVPLFGEFEITEQEVRFKGRLVSVPVTVDSPGAETEEKPMFGLLLSNRTLADGDVAADVQFEDVGPDTACELAVAYDANAGHIVNAGLGGESWALFTIREFGGPKMAGPGWRNHRAPATVQTSAQECSTISKLGLGVQLSLFSLTTSLLALGR